VSYNQSLLGLFTDRIPAAVPVLGASYKAHAKTTPADGVKESDAATVATVATDFVSALSEAGSLSPALSKEEAPSLAHENLTSPQANPRDTASIGQSIGR
jgi:hypothetical protein